MHIIADVRNLSTDPAERIKICNLGIMGTKYIRDTVLSSAFEVNQGESLSFSVSHIYSAITIGTVL